MGIAAIYLLGLLAVAVFTVLWYVTVGLYRWTKHMIMTSPPVVNYYWRKHDEREHAKYLAEEKYWQDRNKLKYQR